MTTVNTTLIDGGELPIVFLHGLFGQGKNWQTIARSLRDEATSLLVDVPNHGRSDWTTRFDYDELADLVYESALAQPGFSGGFVLVGHSMGGKIAMRIALRHPEAVTALVVVDISPVAGTLGQAFPGLVAALRSLPLAGLSDRATADELLATDIPSKQTRGFLLQNLVRRPADQELGWQMNLELLGDSLDQVGGWPATTAQYGGPVLWLAGDSSEYVRPEHTEDMRRLFPAVITVRVKDAGHWVHADQPGTVVTALRSFLANVLPDAQAGDD